jgi:hypothetical protein
MNPLEYAKRIAYSSEETLALSYDMSAHYRDLPGCYVECGVAAGAQIIAMRAAAPNKTIHAFDSFMGIPRPSNRDDQMPGIKMLTETERKMLPNPGEQDLISTGATSVSYPDFVNHMVTSGAGLSNLFVHEGWFEETVEKSYTGPIAILRLDGDLYNSTFVCLQHLFDRVIPGGCVIIDDWELPGSRDACIDFFAAIKYTPKYQFVSNIAYFTTC